MRIIVLILILASSYGLAQSNHTWFPSNLNIHPFTANFLEPKAGFSYLLRRSEIRLDIGSSSDIYQIEKENSLLSFGADLFTFTRLRGEKEFHFPVETIDYLFGINAGYKIVGEDIEYGFRFRLSHISAHFVDGHFDYSINDWRNGREPKVYSREFIELFPFYRINGIRVYSGITYLIHVAPKEIGNLIYQIGFDFYSDKIFSRNIYPFIAYDFKLFKINKFSGSNIISAGIKFGSFNEKGLSIYFSYYSGKSIHGEYYDLNENYSSIGLNIDI